MMPCCEGPKMLVEDGARSTSTVSCPLVLQALELSFDPSIIRSESMTNLICIALPEITKVVRIHAKQTVDKFIRSSEAKFRYFWNLEDVPFRPIRSTDPTIEALPKCDERRMTLQALLLIVLRPEIPLKYRNIEAFLIGYPEFRNKPSSDLEKLRMTANWMDLAFYTLSPKNNKTFLMSLIPRLCEGRSAKYITGSGESAATSDRVLVYHTEGKCDKKKRPGRQKTKQLVAAEAQAAIAKLTATQAELAIELNNNMLPHEHTSSSNSNTSSSNRLSVGTDQHSSATLPPLLLSAASSADSAVKSETTYYKAPLNGCSGDDGIIIVGDDDRKGDSDASRDDGKEGDVSEDISNSSCSDSDNGVFSGLYLLSRISDSIIAQDQVGAWKSSQQCRIASDKINNANKRAMAGRSRTGAGISNRYGRAAATGEKKEEKKRKVLPFGDCFPPLSSSSSSSSSSFAADNDKSMVVYYGGQSEDPSYSSSLTEQFLSSATSVRRPPPKKRAVVSAASTAISSVVSSSVVSSSVVSPDTATTNNISSTSSGNHPTKTTKKQQNGSMGTNKRNTGISSSSLGGLRGLLHRLPPPPASATAAAEATIASRILAASEPIIHKIPLPSSALPGVSGSAHGVVPGVSVGVCGVNGGTYAVSGGVIPGVDQSELLLLGDKPLIFPPRRPPPQVTYNNTYGASHLPPPPPPLQYQQH